MRIAIVNWTNRRVGGAETYLARLIPGLQATHHHLFLWHETAEPASREPIPGTAGLPSCCANDVGVDNALRALKAWQPDVLYVHGLTNPVNEKALLAIAPAVLFAHGYYGTCNEPRPQRISFLSTHNSFLRGLKFCNSANSSTTTEKSSICPKPFRGLADR